MVPARMVPCFSMAHLLTSLGRLLRCLCPCPRLYACRHGRRRMLKKAHLLRWRPRPPCHVTRETIGRTNFRLRVPDMAPHSPYETTPRVRPSVAASHLDLFEHPASSSATCWPERGAWLPGRVHTPRANGPVATAAAKTPPGSTACSPAGSAALPIEAATGRPCGIPRGCARA